MCEIIVNHSVKKLIKEELNTTDLTTRTVLFGMTNTEKAKAILAKALELGSVKVASIKQ